MPTSSRPTALLAPIGRGDHTSPPGIAPQLMKKPCHCEGAPRPWQSASPSAAVFMSPTAPFLSAAKEREERTPPKPRFWNPSAYRHAINENLYLAQSVCANLSLLSHAPCVYHRCPLLQWNRNARSDNRGSHCYASVGEENSVRPTVTK